MASSTVGQLIIGIKLDDKDAKKAFKSIEVDAIKAGDKVKEHSTAVAAAISTIVDKAVDAATRAASTAVKVVGDSVRAFGDYEQLLGGVETLFGDAAGAVQQYADKAFQTAGLSANEYMSTVTSFSARLLQGLGGDTQKAAQIGDMAVTDMADNANKMGSSMQSIQDAYQGFAKQNYTMLDNLKLGYGGTASEMARLINDSGVLGNTMKVTANNVNDVSFDKIIEAIHVTQDNLKITGTTAKEAAETIQGSVASTKAAWQNMMVAMASGQDFTGVFDGLTNSISNVLNNIIPIAQNAMSGLSQLVGQIGPMLAGILPRLVNSIVPGALQLLTDVILALAQAIPGTLAALVDAFVSALPGMIDSIALAIPPLLTEIVNAFIKIAELLTSPDMISKIIEAAMNLLMAIVEAIPKIIPPLIAALPRIIDNIILVFQQNLPVILNGAVQMFMAIVDAIPQLITMLGEALPKIINAIVTFLTEGNTISMILDAALKMLDAIIEALPQIIEALANALPDILTAIVNFLTNPATIMQLIDAAIQLFFALVQAVPRIMGALIGAFGTLVGSLWESIKGMFGAFASNFGNFIGGIFKAAINGVLGFIENIINGPIDIINGFIGTINSAFGFIGVNLGTIGRVNLPRLAQGGYADSATAAVFGEAGKEVALPLERNTDNWSGLLAAALAEEFEMGEASAGGERTVNNTQNIIVNDDMDIRKVGNAFLQEIRRVA